ncbi:MAG: glutamate--tRNA ligase, partial [Candidatus Methanomethylophilaceae archaeon]
KIFADAGEIRLKDLCNIKYGTPAIYDGNDVSILKTGVHAVQWVCRESIPATILMPDGTVVEGLAESSILNEKSDTVQFERIGFVKLERISPEKIEAVYTHR